MSGAAGGAGRSGDPAARCGGWKLLALGLLSASSMLAAAPGAGAMSREEKRRLGNQVLEMFDHAYSNYMVKLEVSDCRIEPYYINLLEVSSYRFPTISGTVFT